MATEAPGGGRHRLIIDGQDVSAHPGQTILQVAREHGIEIPTLCYSPRLEPIGSCRLCIVEVAGTPTPAAACMTPAAEGMIVTTRSTALERQRRETLKLILARHPLLCSACELDGECALQALAYRYDVGVRELLAIPVPPVEDDGRPYATPLIEYHPRRCIVCGRCVQACGELAVAHAIGIHGEGAAVRIVPVPADAPGLHECISCGECLSVCPINALTETYGRPRGRPWERHRTTTVCAYCGCGCELDLETAAGSLTRVLPSGGGPNAGELCVKGRFGYDFVDHPDRLRRPLIREGDGWRDAGWDEALDLVAEHLAAARLEHGPDAVGALASARCSNEENYLLQKLMRAVIGSNNIDHCARL